MVSLSIPWSSLNTWKHLYMTYYALFKFLFLNLFIYLFCRTTWPEECLQPGIEPTPPRNGKTPCRVLTTGPQGKNTMYFQACYMY